MEVEGLNPERDAIYKKYAESQGEEAEATPEEVEASEETEKEETPKEEYAPEAAPEEAETPPEAEKQVREEEKTVSLAALHEERAKRKALNQEVSELKSQVQQLINDNMTLMQKEPEDADELATRREIYELKQTIEEQKKQLESYGNQYQQNEQRRQQEALEQRLDATDKALEAEGFPGFKTIGKHLIIERFRQMDAEDVQALDTPEGWKQLYKEEYPKVRGYFVTQSKKETFDAKKAQKEKAALAGSTGKSKAPEPEKKEWDYKDYMKMRKERGLS